MARHISVWTLHSSHFCRVKYSSSVSLNPQLRLPHLFLCTVTTSFSEQRHDFLLTTVQIFVSRALIHFIHQFRRETLLLINFSQLLHLLLQKLKIVDNYETVRLVFIPSTAVLSRSVLPSHTRKVVKLILYRNMSHHDTGFLWFATGPPD